MSQSIANPYDAALKYWKSVRTRLEHTIQDYIQACEQLDSVLNTSLALTTRHLRDDAFAELDLELPSLSSLEQTLSKSRCSLETLRNSSFRLSPINSIPSEILLMIFSLASQDWVEEEYVETTNKTKANACILSSVCTLWRRLMLSSTSFWSHIELVLTGFSTLPSLKTAELWAQRSRGALLDVSISESDKATERNAEATYWSVSRAVEFLAPLFPRVRKLKVHTDDGLAQIIAKRFAKSWVNQGAVGSAEALDIRLEEGLEVVSLPGDETDLSPQSFNAFFTSLRVLRLRNALIDLNGLGCTGLEELHLQYLPGWNPTASEIATILQANPRLRSLAFIDISFFSDLPATTDPIALDRLEVLTLEGGIPFNLWSVLRLIKSSSDAVRLSFSMGNDAQYIDSLHSFLGRCRVTMLHLQGETRSELHISAILTPMPFLKTLILRYFTLDDKILQDFLRQRSSDPQPLHLWPNLESFYLLGSNPSRDFVSRLGSLLLPAQELLIGEDPARHEEILIEVEESGELYDELSRRGVELVWIDDSSHMFAWDPTTKWTFVHN
ncbi:F-box-like protein [Ceratobasidium sp. AG-Ba]|nr:F-box-like protein [Ceratobasidium sp. AG-Ba]